MVRHTRKTHAASFHSGRRSRPDVWLLRHVQVALASLGRLVRSPLSTLMTSAVIGIALALPAGLHLLLGNIQLLSGNWDGAATLSLFLRPETTPQRAAELLQVVRAKPGVTRVRLITREQALDEFRRLSGFSGALDSLGENPLPAVIVVEPRAETPEAAEAMLNELQRINEVDFAQLDLQWVRRLHAIADIARRGVLVLASLLGLAVLLIVVNTIRLEIQNRHAEIEITKLIGATNAFIRRPFLYCGIWYGLFGGLISWLLVTLSLSLLDAPVARLAGLYGSGFRLEVLDIGVLLLLVSGSTLLGLCGSWIAVGRHLNETEPT